jgi:hypothetical protein
MDMAHHIIFDIAMRLSPLMLTTLALADVLAFVILAVM